MSQNKAFSTPFILAVLCIYFSYFLHGISVITLAQNMSSLAEKFSTDNAGIAYLISGIGLGRLISILFFGVISDKFGRRAVILMAVIMYLLFFFGIPACPNLTLAYGLAVCVGIANSALDTGGYPALMECFPKASGSAVILVKAMVSFGQMFYPMLVSYMLLNNIWYGYGLIIPGILFVLNTLMLLISSMGNTVSTTASFMLMLNANTEVGISVKPMPTMPCKSAAAANTSARKPAVGMVYFVWVKSWSSFCS